MERISGDYSADKIKRDVENELLKEKAKLLDEEIKEDIENETDEERLDLLYKIYYLSSYGKSYETKEFLYNNGNFRTQEEIDAYNERIERKEAAERYKRMAEEGKRYASSGEYAKDSGSSFTAWIPFLLNVVLFIFDFCGDMDYFIELLILLPVTLTITLILMLGRDKKIIRLGEEHCVPKDNEIYVKARRDYGTGKIAATGAAISSLHTISKGVKNISNPSKW